MRGTAAALRRLLEAGQRSATSTFQKHLNGPCITGNNNGVCHPTKLKYTDSERNQASLWGFRPWQQILNIRLTKRQTNAYLLTEWYHKTQND